MASVTFDNAYRCQTNTETVIQAGSDLDITSVTVSEIAGSEDGVFTPGESVTITVDRAGGQTVYQSEFIGWREDPNTPGDFEAVFIFEPVRDEQLTPRIQEFYDAFDLDPTEPIDPRSQPLVLFLSNSEYENGDDCGGMDTDTSPPCFAPGTLIATDRGEIAVEDLRPGDVARTADGGRSEILWIGRTTRVRMFSPPELVCPIRIAAGALGDGRPHRDLDVTADHAIILGDLAINAGALVNDRTIRRVDPSELPDVVVYYHVETREHVALLANGAPAESFIDYRSRREFDNFDDYAARFGEEVLVREMPLMRISARRLLPADLRRRLNSGLAETER